MLILFLHFYSFILWGTHVWMSEDSLQELKSPCPPCGTWGSNSVVRLGGGKHLYPPSHLARPVLGALMKIVSSLIAVSVLGKLTSWTWHPSRAVWLSRQIRALPHDSPNRNQVMKIFFHPVVNAKKKWSMICPYPNLKSFGENKYSPEEMMKREQKQRGVHE